MDFKYDVDKLFFADLFSCEVNELNKYSSFFDFRNPQLKRKEFNSSRNGLYSTLVKQHGELCMLNLGTNCDIKSGFAIDHIIPLSSNVLNKRRGIVALPNQKSSYRKLWC
ncbi:MAG: hypothetical protein ABL940_07785 [Bacteroidia bacterium]